MTATAITAQASRGREITPCRRARIVKANTCVKIARHAKRNLSKDNPHVSIMIERKNLDRCPRPRRPTVLSEEDKDRLVIVTKRDCKTRRMPLAELQVEAGLASVSKQTVLDALYDKEYKLNREPGVYRSLSLTLGMWSALFLVISKAPEHLTYNINVEPVIRTAAIIKP